MRVPLSRLALCGFGLLTLLFSLGRLDAQAPDALNSQRTTAAPSARPALQFPPVKFVTALCRDLAGNIWIGSEDQGI